MTTTVPLRDASALEETGSEWLSAYLYAPAVRRFADLDAVIRVAAGPIIDAAHENRLIERAFFIRYRDPRFHIRLRLRCRGDQTQRATQLVNDFWSTARGTCRGHDLRWIPYEPETERYGGPGGLAIAEEFFCYSSRLAIALVADGANWDDAARFGCATAAAILCVRAFRPDGSGAASPLTTWLPHSRTLMRAIGEGTGVEQVDDDAGSASTGTSDIAGLVRSVWRSCEMDAALPEPFQTFMNDLTGTRVQLLNTCSAGRIEVRGAAIDWDNTRSHLLPSYLHMTNNRLGVSPRLEHELMPSLRRALAIATEVGE